MLDREIIGRLAAEHQTAYIALQSACKLPASEFIELLKARDHAWAALVAARAALIDA